MNFPLTVNQFAQWAQNNRKKRFKIREGDRRLPTYDWEHVDGRSNSCPLATCLKNKKLAGAYTEVDGNYFSPDLEKRPDERYKLPKWAQHFVSIFDKEDTDDFTGAQILRIIKEGDLCELEKAENAEKEAQASSHSVTN